jgi:hypothetical protein
MQATFTLESRARIDRDQVINSVRNAGVPVARFLDVEASAIRSRSQPRRPINWAPTISQSHHMSVGH